MTQLTEILPASLSQSTSAEDHERAALDILATGLRSMRKARRWSQERLADACDLHPETIGRLERREYRTLPPESTMDSIRLAFGFPNLGSFWQALQAIAQTKPSDSVMVQVSPPVARLVDMFSRLTEVQRHYIESLVLHFHAKQSAQAQGEEDLCQFDPPFGLP
jgi:transcriptional regulator with XRE-family HTH domain